MDTSLIATWYDFYLQQAAAEAYFEGVTLLEGDAVVRVLSNGNNRPEYSDPNQRSGKTWLANVQATDFLSKFQVLHQWSDNPLRDGDLAPGEPGYLELNGQRLLANTGLSATLIQNRETGAYTLSIRSTEYVTPSLGGDQYRDLFGADLQDLAVNGFAFAQIDALERYYQWLLANEPGLSGGQLYVTGYSLSGHLATVFTEMHPEVVHAYTFNGAGRGEWDRERGSLSDMLAYYREVLRDPALAPDINLSPGYAILRTQAIERSSELFDPVSVYDDFRYQWAVLATVERFGISSLTEIAASSFRLTDPDRVDLTNGANARVTQLYGKAENNDTELVANTGIHGPAQRLFIEDQPNVSGILGIPESLSWGGYGSTHSITLLGDSLAVMRVTSRLDAGVTTETLRQMFAAASNERGTGFILLNGSAEGDSLERIVSALGALFRVELEPMNPVRTESGFADFAQRNLFHENLQRISNEIGEQQAFGIVSIANASAEDLLSWSREDGARGVATRYALSALNPFIVIGLDYESRHNAAGELDLWDPQTGQGTLTPDWLNDRIAFLTWKNLANREDIAIPRSADAPSQRFIDIASGRDIFVPGPEDELSEVPLPGVRRFVFGSAGSDPLFGSIGGDRVYGSGGTDYLSGGLDNDRLEGGAGVDVYNYGASNGFLVSRNDGEDRILDTDGRGVLRYVSTSGLGTSRTATVIADAFRAMGNDTWKSADERFTFVRSIDASGVASLRITFDQADATGSLTLEHFEDGDFGIRLQPQRSLPTITETVLGDRATKDVDPNTPGVQEGRDLFNRVITTDEPGAPREDFLFGRWPYIDPATGTWVVPTPGGPGEKIDGGAADDLIIADPMSPYQILAAPLQDEVVDGQRPLDNDDWVLGGSGRDRIYGGGGDDLIEGGSDGVSDGEEGGDVVYGGNGDDDIFGNEFMGFDTAILVGDAASGSGVKGDFLSGGAGEDRMIGTTGQDVLLGGGGTDLLIGGAGNDVLYGGAGYVAVNLGWSVVRSTDTSGGFEVHQVQFNGVELRDVTVDASDTIYGGRGADWAFGGSGDDFIDGGADDDVVYGEGGADTLLGGAGNDVLVGDKSEGTMPADAAGDYLDGGDGSDRLYGDVGDDILAGGRGNDFLLGGAGRDIYLFEKGDGEDWIIDTPSGSNDPEASVLVLGEGFDRSSVTFRLGSLLIDLGPSDPEDPTSMDRIHVEGFNPDDPFATRVLAEIRFSNGEVMTYDEILARGFDIEGTEGDDDGQQSIYPSLLGTAVSDRIRGLAGKDTLAGLAGDDLLDGGTGNDTLQGGEGDDVLVGGAGADNLWGGAGRDRFVVEGADVIWEAEGGDEVVLPANVIVADLGARMGWHQGIDVIEVTAGGETLFRVPGGTGVADGLTLIDGDGIATPLADLLGAALHEPAFLTGGFGDDFLSGFADADRLRGESGNDHLAGYAGEDTIEGGWGDDLLIGGVGADALYGDAGNDEYRFQLGDGVDRIDDRGGGVDTIRFAANVATASIVPLRMANGDLIVRYGDGDAVTVGGYYGDSFQRIERLVAADGAEWSEADLLALSIAPIDGTSGDDVLVGTGFAEILEGGAGDDLLDGRGGIDVLRGGDGRDTYLLSWGQGHDRVEESGIGPEEIRLGATVTFDDLTVRRHGDDLVVALGVADRFQLAGAAIESGRWTMADAQGNTRSIEALLAATEARSSDAVAASRHAYLVELEAAWFATWAAQGFGPATTGTVGREPQSVGLSEAVTNVYSTTFRMPDGEITGESVRTLSDGGVESLVVGRDLRAMSSVVIESDATLIDVAITPLTIPVWYDPTVVRETERQYQFMGTGPSFTTVFDPTPDDPTDAFFITASSQTFLRYGRSYAVGVGTTEVTRENREVQIRIPIVAAGEGANRIEYAGPGLINAGAGDDVVLPMTSLKESQLTVGQGVPRAGGIGAWLSGGLGNDRLVGTRDADTLAGGDGTDVLEGGRGADRYLVLATDAGVDLIEDPERPPDGEVNGGLRGEFYRWLERTGEPRGRGAEVYAVDDERVLRSGVVDRDVLAFGPGIDADDLSVSFEMATIGPYTGQTLMALRWAGGGADLPVGPESDWRHVLPWNTGIDPLLGSTAGIERVEFADGEVVSLTELRRGVLHRDDDLVLARGDGNVIVGGESVGRRLRFGPDIFPRDLVLHRDGRDAVIALADGTDSWRIAGWFGADGAVNVSSIRFHDTGYWDVAPLTGKLLQVDGGDASEALVGVNGFDNTLSGFGGEDAIIGGDGDDILSGGEGNDTLEGDAKILVPLVVRARGSAAQGVDARMEVRVDGVAIGVVDVASTSGFAPYRFDLALMRGVAHRIDVMFINDAYVAEPRQDRNLFVESITVGSTRFAANGVGVSYDRGSGAAAFDGNDVIAGQATMAWNGALRFDVPASVFWSAGDDRLDGGLGADRMEGGAGDDTYFVDDPGDRVIESATGGWDQILATTDLQMPDGVEALTLETEGHTARGSRRNDLLGGSWGDDALVGAGGHDILQGGWGNDRLSGEGSMPTEIVVRAKGSSAAGIAARMEVRVDGAVAGTFDVDPAAYRNYTLSILTDTAAPHAVDVAFINDAWFPELGQDRNLFVESVGFGHASKLPTSPSVIYDRGAGVRAYDGLDLLAGQGTMPWNGALRFAFAEPDALNDLLDASWGDDVLEGGAGNDFVAGGAGADSILVDRGTDIVAFNRGDGEDAVRVTGAGLAHVSLGGGLRPEELQFRRSGSDLVVEAGMPGDRLTFAEWFDGTLRPAGAQFQFVESRLREDGVAEPSVERYDFATVIAEVHAAQDAQAAVAGQWERARVAMDALGSGDAEALGGDLAVYYGLTGSFSGLSADTSQGALGSPNFGIAPQAFQPPEPVSQGIRTLA